MIVLWITYAFLVKTYVAYVSCKMLFNVLGANCFYFNVGKFIFGMFYLLRSRAQTY